MKRHSRTGTVWQRAYFAMKRALFGDFYMFISECPAFRSFSCPHPMVQFESPASRARPNHDCSSLASVAWLEHADHCSSSLLSVSRIGPHPA